jgi:uncharacterized protein (TIGR00251 family)
VEPSTRITLRVTPGSPRPGIAGRTDGAWKVRVGAPPADGRANAALVRLLAAALGVAPRDVAIVAGHGGRDKVVALAGLAPAEVERRLSSAAEGGAEGA